MRKRFFFCPLINNQTPMNSLPKYKRVTDDIIAISDTYRPKLKKQSNKEEMRSYPEYYYKEIVEFVNDSRNWTC